MIYIATETLNTLERKSTLLNTVSKLGISLPIFSSIEYYYPDLVIEKHS